MLPREFSGAGGACSAPFWPNLGGPAVFDTGLQPLSRVGKPSRPALPPATYYLGGVNNGQRAVYDGHCSERYAARSPFHYSSRDEVAGRASLAADICDAPRP